MNKISLVVISAIMILVTGTVSALADPSLTDIMNDKFGTGNYHEITSTNVYKFTPGKYVITVLVDQNAGYINPTGWYTAGNSNPDAQHELYSDPAANLANGDVTRNLAPTSVFGLYINAGSGVTYFSEPGLNPDKSDPVYKGQHVKCFMIDSGSEKGAYVLGFEDLSSAEGSDWDYQDVVIELKGTDLSSTSSKLVANFSASPTSGKAPLIVNFTDTSTGSPISWQWTFGDSTSSTEQNPVHKYTKSGNYSVVLRVWNKSAGSSVTKSNYISVANPIADFSASPTYGKAPLTVNFTDKSVGIPNCWYWNFGDGTSSNLQNPVHKYDKSGKYTVMLRVWSGAANSSVTKSNYISVISPPVAAFYATPISGKAPLTVKFIDKSTGLPKSWYWDFGDGGTSNLQSPTHTYTVGGYRKYYTVSLTVQNEAGVNTKKTYNYIRVDK